RVSSWTQPLAVCLGVLVRYRRCGVRGTDEWDLCVRRLGRHGGACARIGLGETRDSSSETELSFGIADYRYRRLAVPWKRRTAGLWGGSEVLSADHTHEAARCGTD